MKKGIVILVFLILVCTLVSCALPGALAKDVKEKTYEDESIEIREDIQENHTDLPIEAKKPPRTPKLRTPDELAVDENGEYLRWKSVADANGYQVRIAGLDRVRRTIVDDTDTTDTPYILLQNLNEGEYFLLVKAMSGDENYLSSDWAVLEYRIGVVAPSGIFEDCHSNWSGVYCLFEPTEDTEGLEAMYCLTCLKTWVIRVAVLPSDDEWMVFKLINGDKEYSVGAHSTYTEKPYEEALIPAYYKGKPVTQIQSMGFYRMLNLKTVEIPYTVTKIEYGAFAYCPNLQTVRFPQGNAHYKFEQGCLIETATNKIISGTNAGVIPSDITSIGDYAFYGLNISNMFIPASIKDIGSCAFNICEELKSVIFEEGSQLEIISSGMFGGCINLHDVTLPDSIKRIGRYAFCGCSRLKSLTIPIHCTYIEALVFEGWDSSQTIYFVGFSSKAEADEAFDPNWDIFDFECVNAPSLVFRH